MSSAEKSIMKNSWLKGFVTPDHSLSSANITPTILKGLGSKEEHAISEEFFDYSIFKGVKNIVLLCVDGMGYHMLPKEMRKLDGFPITSLAPSTTTTVWPSVFTGLTPQEHGIMGFWLYLRELGEVTTMTRFGPSAEIGSFADAGIDPTLFFPFQTIHHKMAKMGFRSTVVNRNEYIDSGLSQMIYQGAEQIGYKSAAEMFAKGSKALSKDKNFVTLYYDSIDMTSHMFGTESNKLKKDFRTLTTQFNRFMEKVPEDTLLLITADHGQINCPEKKQLNFTNHPELLSRLSLLPNGEGRFVYLFSKKGRENKVMSYCKEHLSDKALVMESEELLEKGMFGHGKVFNETRNRIGDITLIVKDNYVITYPFLEGRGTVGFHGGLNKEEMLVPLLWKQL